MADLSFVFGTMESGKTTKLLQDNYNYRKHGHKVIVVKPLVDTKGGDEVISRTNDHAKVDILLSRDDSLLSFDNLRLIIDAKVILIDEAQFCSAAQVKEFWEIAHIIGIPVVCYGLKSNFQGKLFEGSEALFGYADKKTELTVNCECGNVAVFNARLVNGQYVSDGDVVAIDGVSDVSYIPLCSDCYLKYVILEEEKEDILQRKRLVK